MQVTQVQLKIIAIGLIPAFFIIPAVMPRSTIATILQAGIVIAAIVVVYLGWAMEKREAAGDDDLLALPPKQKK